VEGILAALLSDLSGAHAELEGALEWFEAHDDDEGRAIALCGLGIATAPIDADRARTLVLERARLFASLGDTWAEAMVLTTLGWLDAGRGDFPHQDLIERAYSLARTMGDDVATAHAAANLAEMRLARGRPDEAREALETAFTAYEAVGHESGMSYGLETAAVLASRADRPEQAARLLGAADGLRDEVAVPIWGPRLTRFETLVSATRATLGVELFEVRWAEGRALGFDAALEQARRTLHPAEPTETS
jgi:hypothetical protein